MKRWVAGKIATMAIGLYVACSMPAQAQYTYDTYGGQAAGPAANEGSIQAGVPPMFVLPNWEGDARSEDLYEFVHPSVWQPWNTYQLQVQQICQQSGAVGTNAGLFYPTPQNAGAGPPAGATTSVTGQVIP
jgi:hypothetical protein